MKYSQMLGLYIHVPFCAAKCSYCDFYSIVPQDKEMDRYCKALIAHIKEYSALCEGYIVDTVYFGGGTPSVFGGKRLARILGAIGKSFRLSPQAEITAEANPDSINKRWLRAVKRAGVNRLSIGMQSAHPEELAAIGRIHSAEQTIEAVKLAQDTGFSNIGLDLIYGLPGQDGRMFAQSVEQALALQPAHLSCYGLKLEEGTRMAQENPVLPDDDAQADIYLALCERLHRAGWEHYEISNWCRPGLRSRHNSKYWDLSPYLGFGPGAHSFFGSRRFAFIKDLEVYCAAVLDGQDSLISEEEDVATEKRHGEYIMLRLRTRDGVHEDEFQKLFGVSFAPYAAKLRQFEKHGMAANDLGRWYLTEQGFLISNSIINEVLDAAE